jgi:hypothetical protein
VGGEDRSTGFSALFTEGHSGELFLELLALGKICGFREAVGKCEELLFLRFFGLNTSLYQINEHAIGTGLARLGDGAHVFRDTSWNRDALADGLLGFWHIAKFTPLCTIMHQRTCGTVPIAS